MSAIQLPNFQPANRRTMIAVLGDAVDLTPIEGRISHSFAVSSKPSGATATFSGAVITPDVAGAWVLTVSAGSDVLTVPCFVYSASAYASLGPKGTPGLISYYPGYPDLQRRAIMLNLANALAPATLTAWNGGVFPPSVNLAQHGG